MTEQTVSNVFDFKKFFVTTVIALALFTAPSQAYGYGSATGNYIDVPAGGGSSTVYRCYNIMYTYVDDYPFAVSAIKCLNGGAVAGDIGVQAALFRSNGDIKGYTGWHVNYGQPLSQNTTWSIAYNYTGATYGHSYYSYGNPQVYRVFLGGMFTYKTEPTINVNNY